MSLLDFLPSELKWELQRFCADPPKAPLYYIKCTGVMDAYIWKNPLMMSRIYKMYHFPRYARGGRHCWYFSSIRSCECVVPDTYEEIARCYVTFGP
jgi:hypothetical protein